MYKKTVILISITSDIGTALAKRYSEDGYAIIGTYRSRDKLAQLRRIPDCRLFYCDINNEASARKFITNYAKLGLKWDTFISCVGYPLPLKAFSKSDFQEWFISVKINAIHPLALFHGLYPHRDRNKKINAIFFAGSGVNRAVKNFSAYAISKIMLIKMCEFLDCENKNLSIFTVDPGWTKTKIHSLILDKISRKDERYTKTMEFLKSRRGTSIDDIYGCINWISSQKKRVSSGRIFSVVHDKWKGKDDAAHLAKNLSQDENMYKLRRDKGKRQ